ncbi:MarR family transcriptional regulator [Arachnia propionica]|uniref:MarR family transcriptional regulator n=1 Tax=Arachnia propionica TaxID=1750 RepID=A0A3P1TFK2_9ACTN|nr:MarR family transcriptional regulator [Arachnia propionica]RRD07343.1 MarR family transcriptional regulator [Arachnia propionica]
MSALEDSWALVTATVGAVELGLGRWLASNHSLVLSDYRALTVLTRSPDRELRISELANRLGLKQSSATRLVERLEDKGLVFRDACPEDGRGVYAVVTPQGIALTEELRTGYDEKLTELLTEHASSAPGATREAIRGAFHTAGDQFS